MKRLQLLESLEKYDPVDVQELLFKERTISFVRQYPDCFARSLEIGHITASAWLVSRDGQSVLLTHHAKLDSWFQLGGHADGNSDVLAVAVKEAQEESGIMGIVPVYKDIFDIDVHLIPATSTEKEHYHYDIRFLLRVTSDEQVICSPESKELRWFLIVDALPTSSPSLARMHTKWMNARF